MYILKTYLWSHAINLLNISLIRKSTISLATVIFSVAAIAANSNQTQRLANQGNADVQAILDTMYYDGKGVRQNVVTTHEY